MGPTPHDSGVADLSTRIGELQDELHRHKRAGDTAGEIESLLAIGNIALEADSSLSMMHFRLAEKVIGPDGPRLHEAVGGQGRVLRRAKRLDDAIERFAFAEESAGRSGNRFAQVRWMLSRAAARRASDDFDGASAIVHDADALLRPPVPERSLRALIGPVNLFDREQVGTLVELEGAIGLSLSDAKDDEGAEDHYRSAWAHAVSIEDWDAVHTWARNAGRVCARRSRYGEALACHEVALAAARTAGVEGRIAVSAQSMADVYRSAFRHQEGGDRLRLLAGELTGRDRIAVLDQALALYDGGLCAEGVIAAAADIGASLGNQPVRAEFRARVDDMRLRAERVLAAPPNVDGVPAMDRYLVHVMSRAMEQRDVRDALEAAYLVCDVRLGLALRGGREWKRAVGGDVLENAGLDARVVTDTLRMIDSDGKELATDLLQRYKAPAYCTAAVRRSWDALIDDPAVRAFADASRSLAEAVEGLEGPAQADFLRPIHAVRRSGERMREAGDAIRARNPQLAAQLGVSVRVEDLIDALPLDGGIAIFDFVIGRDATVGAIYTRGADGVVVTLLETPSFTIEQVRALTALHQEANVSKSLGGRQTEALLEIATILHDHFFCKFAQMLSSWGITQLVLVPDLTTRGLPLHLSKACGQEFAINGIETSDASFLCEVMPVEYSPALQAIAASQYRLRPRALRKIAGFADPRGDLVGTRVTLEEFGKRLGEDGRWSLATGAAMTRAAVNEAIQSSDLVVFGTHGHFAPGDLKSSHLVMHDEPWSVEDMLGVGDLDKSALMVLVACEAGAVAMTPDDDLAWGIPGALLSAGASAVLSNLWPVVDVTANVLLDRFLVHLAHPGYRPAAALFRAVRDLRRMPREEALAACRAHYELLRRHKAEPRAIVSARTLMEWVEDTDSPTPFASPYFWGATVIVGSGWHLPAGAEVGNVLRTLENEVELASIASLLSEGKARDALAGATRVARRADGRQRGRAYVMMADGMMRSADLTIAPRVRRRVRRLLDDAARIARAAEDTELQQWVETLRPYAEEQHVV
ncbi:MAG: CHAT domain-containing protein [Gemmatimonadaceae bacterium]